MPFLFVYLLKVNLALVLFYIIYYYGLRKLTFYTVNRIFLIFSLVFSSVYPLGDFTAIMEGHKEYTAPIQQYIPDIHKISSSVEHTGAAGTSWSTISFIFWAGAALMGIRLFVQLLSLLRIHIRSYPVRVEKYTFRSIGGDLNPFSFWKAIYINPALYGPEDLEAILEHEKIHTRGLHTMDVLLAGFFTVFYWFNPGMWLLKKAVKENIEFIADREILRKGTDRKGYQYSLVRIGSHLNGLELVNNFNMNIIRKRILMMNTKESSPLHLGLYALLLPAVILIILLVTVPKQQFAEAAGVFQKPVAIAKSMVVKNEKEAVLPNFGEAEKSRLRKQYNKNRKALSPERKKGITLNPQAADAETDNRFSIESLKQIRQKDTLTFFFDGKEASPDNLQNVNPSGIRSIRVIKRKDAPGIAGQNTPGVSEIFIETNKSSPSESEEQAASAGSTVKANKALTLKLTMSGSHVSVSEDSLRGNRTKVFVIRRNLPPGD